MNFIDVKGWIIFEMIVFDLKFYILYIMVIKVFNSGGEGLVSDEIDFVIL